MTQKLPDAVIEAALQYRGQYDHHQWDVGDFVASVVAEAASHKIRRTTIFRQLAVPLGVSRATVSDLCHTAETYEPSDRERYGSVLTWGHFREAARSKTHHPVELLEWACQGGDDHNGTPAGVDALRRHVQQLNAGLKDEPTPAEQFACALARALNALDDAIAIAVKDYRNTILEMYCTLEALALRHKDNYDA